MIERIYLSPPNVGREELLELEGVVQSGWIAPAGPSLEAFENALRKRFSYLHVLALNSGTAALHLAIKLCGITRGDKVVVGSLTFVAAANVVLYEGGIPVLIDSDSASWNLNPELLSYYLSNSRGPLPKAVIVTHVYGKPARMEEIITICQEYGIRVIEDAAEAAGTQMQGTYAGSWGDFGVLSFNGNKTITTGGGGALILKDAKERERARFLAEQGKESLPYYFHQEIGYNYRLSSPLAAIGIAQLNKLDTFLKRKLGIKDYYMSHLSEEFFEFPSVKEGESHWLTVALLRNGTGLDPASLIKYLDANGIESRHTWNPLHNQPFLSQYESINKGVGDDLFARGICLPSGTGLSESQQDFVISAIHDWLRDPV